MPVNFAWKCLAIALVCVFSVGCSTSNDAQTEPKDNAEEMGSEDAGSNEDSSPDVSEDQPAPVETMRRVLVPSEEQVYAGWYTHDLGDEWDEFREVLGGTPPVVFTFHDWNAAGTSAGRLELQTFDAPLEGNEDKTVLEAAREISEAGGILAVAWDAIGYVAEEESYWNGSLELATSFEELLAGTYDDYIRTCARQIRDLGVPVMLSPFAEIDSTAWFMFGPDELTALELVDDTRGHYGDPNVPDGPERLRDGYRHVVDIFREEEVTNVTWFMYAATGYMGLGDKSPEEFARIDEVHPRHYYPGDDYIDWIGTSVYVTTDDASMGDELGTGLAAWREVTQRPFFIPELGFVAVEDADRTESIAAVVEELPGSGVSLVAFADSALYALVFEIPRLADRPNEAEAWRKVMSDPRYARELVFEER